MIIMYTDYDDVTGVLAGYAQQFTSEFADQLSTLLSPPHEADAIHAESVLAANRAPFFFFGHGTKAGLTAQNLAIIDFNQVPHLLSERLVCATCCESAEVLENAMKNHKASGIGYAGVVYLFLEAPYSRLMQECILASPRALARGQSPSQAGRGARDEFDRLARELIKGSIEDQLYATFLNMNANRIRVFEH